MPHLLIIYLLIDFEFQFGHYLPCLDLMLFDFEHFECFGHCVQLLVNFKNLTISFLIILHFPYFNQKSGLFAPLLDEDFIIFFLKSFVNSLLLDSIAIE